MNSISSAASGYNKSSQVRPPKPIDLKSLHTPHKLAAIVCKVPEMKKDYLPYFNEEDLKKQQQHSLLIPLNSKQQLLKPPTTHRRRSKKRGKRKNKNHRNSNKSRQSSHKSLKRKPNSHESKDDFEDDLFDDHDDDGSQIDLNRQSSTKLPGSQSIHKMKTQNSFRKNNTNFIEKRNSKGIPDTIQENTGGISGIGTKKRRESLRGGDNDQQSPIINLANSIPIQPNTHRFDHQTHNQQIVPPTAGFARPKPHQIKAPNMSNIRPEDIDQQISFTYQHVAHMKDIGPSPSDVSIGNKSIASSMFSDDDEKKSKLSQSQRFMDLQSNPEITDADDDASEDFSDSMITDDDDGYSFHEESDDLVTEDDMDDEDHDDSDHHHHHHHHHNHHNHHNMAGKYGALESMEEEKKICIRIAKVLYENSWTGEMICDANEFSKQEYDAILGVGDIPTDSLISNLVWKVINYSQKKTENELINEDKEHIKWYWFDANDMESDWKYRKYNVIICEWISSMYKDFLVKCYDKANANENDNGNDNKNDHETSFAECQANFIKLQQNKGTKKRNHVMPIPGENDGNDDGKDDSKDVDDIDLDIDNSKMNSKKKKQLLIDPYFAKNDKVDHFLLIEKEKNGDVVLWHKIVMNNNENGKLEYLREIKMDHRVVGVKVEMIVTNYEANPSPFAIPSQLAA